VKLEIEVSEKNESTESPWWVIIDPQELSDPLNFHLVASQISGPFFSRESAQRHLSARRYAFGKGAVVYCMSGYPSDEYKLAYHAAKRAHAEQENQDG
jgi:hypothetical protein